MTGNVVNHILSGERKEQNLPSLFKNLQNHLTL